MQILYADLAFFLNCLMDYLALCCTVHLTGFPLKRGRLILAAVAGGLYGCVSMVLAWETPFLNCFVAGVLVYLGFGWDRWFFRRYVLFWIVSFVLAGAVMALQTMWFRTSSIWLVFLVSLCFCYFAMSVIFHAAADERTMRVRAEICYEGRRIRLTLLRDSGNTLRDPLTGQTLCIIWEKALTSIFTGKRVFFHRISYNSLGQTHGELTYFYCDSITVDGTTYYRYPIGISSHSLSGGKGYAGLWGIQRKGEDCFDSSTERTIT